jgi:tetratricopeptide (TPR) repeat protein
MPNGSNKDTQPVPTVQKLVETAKALNSQGRMREAEEHCRAALRIDPGHVEALHGLGAICLQSGRPAEAIDWLQRAAASEQASVAVLSALGMALAQAKRLEEAVEVYKKLAAIPPPSLQALNNLGYILTSLGRHEEALFYLQQGVALDPNSIQTNANLSIVLMALNRPEEALACHERIVAANPQLPEPACNLALTLSELGRDEEAVVQFEKALALNPDFVVALNGLGNTLQKLERYDPALRCFERALALAPGFAVAHYNCGQVLAKLGRHEEAIGQYRTAVAINPGSATVFNDLGISLTALGRHREAVVEFENALRILPGLAPARHNLANALNNLGLSLIRLGRYQEAVAEFERALGVLPEFILAKYSLGEALSNLGRPEEALAVYEKVVAANPDDALAYLGIGDAKRYMGQIQDACAAYERAVALAPRSPVCHRSLADVWRFGENDPRLAALEELERDVDQIPKSVQPDLYFALAKAYDDLKRYGPAFECLQKGNALKRRLVVYDEAMHLDGLRKIAAVFTPELFAARGGTRDPSDVPVFVVGMPRSGTTLVEQILASHPQVFGAGELNHLTNIFESRPTPGRFPFDPDLLTDEWLREIGCRYVAEVRALAPRALRITDKMTGNFRLIGLIHLALPKARIIHVQRDPLDICFSCYSHLFRDLDFTYDLGELGRSYKSYEALMTHWRSVLPQGKMLEVQYENLVNDFEVEARRLVEYCGLEWDERCLAFHKTERPVHTTSAHQVRQPLYRGAIGRARHYEPWLGPLRDALGIQGT